MARRRSRTRRRRRNRHGAEVAGAAVLVLAAVLAAPTLIDFLRAAWVPVALVVVALAALACVVVVALRRSGHAYRRQMLAQAGVDALTPRQFEQFTAELLRDEGFRRVRVVGGAGDRGIDVLGVAPGGSPYAVQCKRYTRPVGPGQVRDFVGALGARAYRDHTGVLVTTNRLSRQALRTAREADVIVIDRETLGDWMMGAYRLTSGRRPASAWLVRLRRRPVPGDRDTGRSGTQPVLPGGLDDPPPGVS